MIEALAILTVIGWVAIAVAIWDMWRRTFVGKR
jgi:hypothetical protein